MLSPEKLSKLLASKKLNESLFVFNELPSTNTFALKLARQPIPQGTIILADRQTAGRGRLERTWFSPPEANIYGSFIFSFHQSFQALGWIPLLAGLRLAQAIEAHTKARITLKWPNDLLINEQKVGGILCESFKKDTKETCAVIGFGLNVNLSQEDLPETLRLTATSLYIHEKQILDRHALLQSIIPALQRGCERLNAEGTIFCRDTYMKYSSTLGSHIAVQFPDGRNQEGFAQSIGDQGQLQISPSPSSAKVQSAIIDIHAGDIQHIRKPSSSI